MLKRFEAAGFKSIKSRVVLDFSDVRDYQFNTQSIRENLLNNIIIYGKNAVGKSNFGLALFDITTHLTDKNVSPGMYDCYLNMDQKTDYAEFLYLFQFGTNELEYCYRKKDVRELISETVKVNGDLIFSYDFQAKKGDFTGLKQLAPTLNLAFNDSSMSIFRYLINNTVLDEAHPLRQTVDFVSRMLWFRNLDENRYIGYQTQSQDFRDFIYEENMLAEFEEFLHSSGVEKNLIVLESPTGQKVLCFEGETPLPFFKTASSGTKALYTFFYWMKTAQNLSLLFIDEFDAYYHYELAESIVMLLERQTAFQTILTSHNTNLLSNRIMRPDCYFILTLDKLTSFANATDRELREGHNLEKLYMNGEFDG